LLLSSSEDEMEEANGNNALDIDIEQNKESKKEVILFLLLYKWNCLLTSYFVWKLTISYFLYLCFM